MRPVTKIRIFGIRLAVVLLAIYWLVMFLGTHIPARLDVSPAMNDKLKHFAAYFVLGTMMCYTTNSQNWIRRFGVIALVGAIYASIDELTQAVVPGRVPDWYDFVADTIGLCLAIGAYVMAKLIYQHWRDRPTANSAWQ